MVDIVVMDGPKWLLAIEIWLRAVNRKPLGAVHGHDPHPECHEFRTLPAWSMELAAIHLLAGAMAMEICATLECPACPGPWCPNNGASTVEEELWVIVGVHEGWTWTEMEVVTGLVRFGIGDQGVSLSVQKGRRW